jgi:hypothetical protein
MLLDPDDDPIDVLKRVLEAWRARAKAPVGEYYLYTIRFGQLMDEVEAWLAAQTTDTAQR